MDVQDQTEEVTGPAAGGWDLIRTGRRREDEWVAVNIKAGRVCMEANADFLHAVALEHLGKDQRLRMRGIILWDEKWRRTYVVARKAGWTPDDYFIHGARLMGERGITTP